MSSERLLYLTISSSSVFSVVTPASESELQTNYVSCVGYSVLSKSEYTAGVFNSIEPPSGSSVFGLNLSDTVLPAPEAPTYSLLAFSEASARSKSPASKLIGSIGNFSEVLSPMSALLQPG